MADRDHRSMSMSDLYRLSSSLIERYASVFYGDDSQSGQTVTRVLAYADFCPDSFTVADRMNNPTFLAPYERAFDVYVRTMIEAKLERLSQEGQVVLGQRLADVTFHCFEQVMVFLQCEHARATGLLNQEFPWVVNRILAYSLFGDPSVPLPTHRSFNALALKLLPRYMERYGQALLQRPLPSLLCLTIASGLIGFDLKSRGTVRQDIIALQPLLHQSVDRIVDQIWCQLESVAEPGLFINDWVLFEEEVLKQPCQLLWFVDDYIETFFDLVFIARILQVNPHLRVTVIAKNGQFENDASIKDVQEMLTRLFFLHLRECDRFTIAPMGPSMGATNLRKLAPAVHKCIEEADVLFLKGSGVHELFQGGVNKPCYTGYILAREFNESELGCDERKGPLVFFRTGVGEYAWWGFKGRAKRTERLADGHEIRLCYSTLLDHRRRMHARCKEDVEREIDVLIDLFDEEVGQQYWYPWRQELLWLTHRLPTW